LDSSQYYNEDVSAINPPTLMKGSRFLKILRRFQYSELRALFHPSSGVFTSKHFVGKATHKLRKKILL
jgi:hypothetical protein